MTDHEAASILDSVAIIGMAGTFPGARDLDEFWRNLCGGVESISFFTDDELVAELGEAPPDHPSYIKARAIIDEIDRFDAGFFGYTPREAEIMDPQQRLFLECAWHALEDAGYDPERYDGAIGVFASTQMSSYLFSNLYSNRDLMESAGLLAVRIANDRDFLPTRVSYKFNLRGPSLCVQTACSSSLVATHLACQSLLDYQCSMALVGGASIDVPQKSGYLYQEGGIFSPDGHCRAFDAEARGTIGGSGVGIVILKRLEDALADGDQIYAVIRGSALNNDGAAKVGFTASSVDGQAAVIYAAQQVADVDPGTIGYVEAHGTGTRLGDPIEIAALTQVFREGTENKQFCAIGSVKTNIGHLDATAGIAGLIKTALALKHRQIPPSLNCTQPNPEIPWADSPFYVNDKLSEWPTGETPRRAGVSSFAVGGTNVHVILEEAPTIPPSAPTRRPWQLLTLSARSEAALAQQTDRLREHLAAHPEHQLADVAYTLHVGRKAFDQRLAIVCRDRDDALDALNGLEPSRVLRGTQQRVEQPVVFLFPGQGAQYVGMGHALYLSEPVFRESIDRCCALLKPQLNIDLREILYPSEGQAGIAAQQLEQTWLTQPALFVIEYALAQLWRSWGVEPAALIGHSIGEYVAATLAGVFSLDDALAIIAARGRLMQQLGRGGMLSVSLPASEVEALHGGTLSLAAVNGPELCVVAGTIGEIEEFQALLESRGIACRRLHTSHAFHSALVEPILKAFGERLSRVRLRPPQIPFVSNLTGTWISAAQAVDPGYWVKHLRQTVRFADGIATLLSQYSVLLEVGPGRTLSTFAHQQLDASANVHVISSLRHPQDQVADLEFALAALGKLWLAGAAVNWSALYVGEERHRVALPTYPFERQRYWIAPRRAELPAPRSASQRRTDLADWFYTPIWKETPLPRTQATASTQRWLILADDRGIGQALARWLRDSGQTTIVVTPGAMFAQTTAHDYTIRPDAPEVYQRLLAALPSADVPLHVIDCWSLATEPTAHSDQRLRWLLAALPSGSQLTILTSHALGVGSDEPIQLEQAALAGIVAAISRSNPEIGCRVVDLALSAADPAQERGLIERLLAECASEAPMTVAYRGRRRWTQTFEALRLAPDAANMQIRPQGVYLLTDGLSDTGLALADYLARSAQARLILLATQELPERGQWQRWCSDHADDDPIRRMIQQLYRLEELGTELLIAQASIADSTAVAALVEQAERRCGPLRGVIHAAGQDLGQSFSELDGLEQLVNGRTIDFVVLYSELAGLLGSDQAAAGSIALADAFVQQQHRTAVFPWIRVIWDRWQLEPEPIHNGAAPTTISAAEGVELFQRLLADGAALHLLISPSDLHARLAEASLVVAAASDDPSATAPQHLRPQLPTAYVAPQTETQQTIAAIWQELLGIASIGIHDNFFELGGHSLLATQVVSRIRDTLHQELPLSSLFESPTVAALADLVTVEEAAPVAEIIPRVARDGDLPLSFAQQRLWFLHQVDPNNTAYTMPFAVRLSGPLDLAILRRCLDEITRRHESLRTTFTAIEGRARQVIHPPQPVPLPIIDLSDTSQAEQAAAIQRIGQQEAQQPFDLSRGPLARFCLLRLGGSEHVIVLALHHSVADGWSIGVLVRELVTLYSAFVQDQESPLPELPIQYVDYTIWQRERLQDTTLRQQLDYWKEQLQSAGMPVPALELPTDRPRPVVQSYRGAYHSFKIDSVVEHALHALSQQEGATLFMTLLAAWQLLLGRYSRQETFAVGSPIANRTRSELESAIGMFVNTLAIRADLSDNPSFRALLDRVRQQCLDAYAHQDLPFEKLVEELQIPRDLSRTPIFQVLFVLQNTPPATLAIDGLRIEQLAIDGGSSPFDLALSMDETEHGLLGALQYNSDLFDPATIERLVGHFQTLLAALSVDPECRIGELPLLAPAELDLLDSWNGQHKEYPQNRCVPQLFAAQAAQTPDAIALICEDRSLSYGELNRRSDRLAAYLQQLGVGPDVLVGLYLERSPDLVVGLLGILKAGGAYVPLDPAYPQQRLSLILADAQMSVIVTQQSLAATLPPTTARIVSLDRDWIAIDRSDAQPLDQTRMEHLAYVIYTSGSTGQPKGVLVEHRNLANVLHASRDHFGFQQGDTMPWLASVAFDIALFELLNPLLVGGKAIILSRDQILDVARLAEDLTRCTALHAVPSLMRQIVHAIRNGRGPHAYDRMRIVFVGGDSVPPDLLDEMRQAFPKAQINVLYGPTEATIICTRYAVPSSGQVARHVIGSALNNIALRLYDQHRQRVPIGVEGELYIGGAGVTRGYLHQPELTDEKYVTLDGQRWYRSGDLARYLPDGTLEFLGRIDQQVKIRGYRIEPGEIEAALGQHPDVHECAVVAREDLPGQRRLVAYVVGENKEQPNKEQTNRASEGCSLFSVLCSPQELRAFLKERLPDYMVPSAFVFLDALPLSNNGKLDRRALPVPAPEGSLAEDGPVAASTAEEELLAAIWAEVLGRAAIGVHDNFFELGGDSILSIQIIAKANNAGLRLTPKDLFQHPTIAELATVVGTAPTTLAEQGLVSGEVPLTPVQRWFFEQPLLDRHHWNQALLFESQQPLDPAVLEQALLQLALHHDALRMRFTDHATGWQQINLATIDGPLLSVIDLTELPTLAQPQAIEARASALQTTLNLAGPLLRAALFELSPDQPQRLLIFAHHLVIDGVSWRILLEDLQRVYQQIVQGQPVTLPPKTSSFKAWAERLAAYAHTPTIQQEGDYWLSALRRSSDWLPVDHQSTSEANTIASSRTVTVALDADTTRALLYDVPPVYHTQINDVLLTALAHVLTRWSGQPVLLDLEGHGREEIADDLDVSRTVGWFTAVFPVILELNGGFQPGAALQSIKEQLRRIPNRGIGYGLLRYLGTDSAAETLRSLPTAPISFNYLGQIDQGAADAGLLRIASESAGAAYSPAGTRSHLIDITASLLDGQLAVGWTYSEAIHTRATVEELAQGFIETLRLLIQHCQQPDAGGYTVSDFTDEDLSDEDLDNILAQIG